MLTVILGVSAAFTGYKFGILYIFTLYMDWKIIDEVVDHFKAKRNA